MYSAFGVLAIASGIAFHAGMVVPIIVGRAVKADVTSTECDISTIHYSLYLLPLVVLNIYTAYMVRWLIMAYMIVGKRVYHRHALALE